MMVLFDAAANAVSLIIAERVRQVTEEGWSLDHDDAHEEGELFRAAFQYHLSGMSWPEAHDPGAHWPWDREWWKPKGPQPDLVRAGALAAAEIDRLRRSTAEPEWKPDRLAHMHELLGTIIHDLAGVLILGEPEPAAQQLPHLGCDP
jgi:hypothetical protein